MGGVRGRAEGFAEDSEATHRREKAFGPARHLDSRRFPMALALIVIASLDIFWWLKR
jgi:hypothetical protein